jgi:FKBP-type peptidyl-prolyl cis-trans isomerase SlyD
MQHLVDDTLLPVSMGTVVSLRYCMKNSQGEILDNILQAKPVEYLHGSGYILPALEQELTGLLAGDKKQVTINNETSILLDASFYFDVEIDSVRPATQDEIEKGKPARPVTQEECGPDCIC